jgi:hypothetical protein
MFRTEFDFILPQGFLDDEGNLHREGTMRLATAADEIVPLKDPRVQRNPAYLVVILLARVVTRLGDVRAITTNTIERLFVADLAYLQDLYNRINHGVDGEEPEVGDEPEAVLAGAGASLGNGPGPRARQPGDEGPASWGIPSR